MTSKLLLCAAAICSTAAMALPQQAHACDPAGTTPQAVVPLNGDRVLPSVEILVIGGGMKPSSEAEVSLTDRAGGEVSLESEVLARPNLFSWLAIYRPAQPLSPTAYDFFASYPFQGGDAETIGTSFQVENGDAATLAKPTIAEWDTVTFAPGVMGQCESYNNATRLVIEPAKEGDAPLWYEVELGMEDGGESQRFAVVPGLSESDGAQVTREMRVDFPVGCVSVTPVGQNGERGESAESCEADRCLLTQPDDVDLENLFADLPECGGSAPGQGSSGGSSNDEACSVAGVNGRSKTPALALLGVLLFGVFRARKKPQRIV
ncbi:hypothetical protein FIV42_23540 [Persicimonas caeni]|uniref:Uncharacterized protein n=1 Tax=Persicimonas caeni TaxID=2292766 RepID=A0A4Y6PZ61_PERCE|nr:hypothetical protein [Persicimonas caeni]QDG53608.1 hypothetical protein FIV42_23540 [Persicimonas caeni]QED34829.1 hypothetical protein FRD00_23535 [Persicimonas caeni]